MTAQKCIFINLQNKTHWPICIYEYSLDDQYKSMSSCDIINPNFLILKNSQHYMYKYKVFCMGIMFCYQTFSLNLKKGRLYIGEKIASQCAK